MSIEKKIKIAAQFLLLFGMTTKGFWSTYLIIWSRFTFPVVWWSVGVLVIAAMLSTGALFKWIWRN